MHTTGAPADQWTATRRWMASDRGVHCRPAAIDGTPGGASAENLVIWGENRPVAEQSPSGDRQVTTGWVYNIVQGQQNRPVSHRSQKLTISQKSADRLWNQVLLGRGHKKYVLWKQYNPHNGSSLELY